MRCGLFRGLCYAPLLLMLGGCGDFMDPPSLDVALPSSWWADAEKPAKADMPTPLQRDWWTAAQDQQLNALVAKIEKQNLSIEQARFRLQAARAETGGSQFLPTLSFDQSTNFEPISVFQQQAFPGVPPSRHLSATFGGYNKVGLDAAWELPLFGVYEAAENQAKANIDYAVSDVDAVRNSVVAEAVADYAQLRAAQAKEVALGTIEENQQRITDLTAIKVKAGLIEDGEQLKQEQMLLGLRSERAAAHAFVVEFKQKLAKLSGVAVADTALDAPAPVPVFPAAHFADTPADVVRNRPDIRKAEQNVISAASDLKLAKADRYPKLSLEGEVFKIDNLIHHPQPETNPAVSFTQGLTMPLFDWSQRLAVAQARDARLAEMGSAYRETVVGAITETQQAMASYVAAETQREQAEASEIRAQGLLKRATILQKQGLSDDLALAQAHVGAARAAIDAAGAQSNEAVSLANVTKALGGGIATQPGVPRGDKE